MPVRSRDNSLFFATALDNSGLRQGKVEALGIIQSLGASISKINPFVALATGAATIFTGIANQAFQFAKRYEQAMKEVQTISTATQRDFAGISDRIFEISQDTLDDPVKLAQAYYQIVSAGYDGAEAMNLLEISSRAAVAGVTDTATAADGITTVMNAFGLAASEADAVADSLFKTVELGKTTFSELSKNIAQAAPIAAAAGLQYEEILAAVASLTKQGVPTAQAFTQIRASIVGANRALGDGFANAFTYQEAMQKIFEQAGGSQTELEKLVGSVEAVSAILAVAGDNADGAAEDLEKVANSGGAASAAFDRMASSNINQWTIFGNRVRAVTKDLGEFILRSSSGLARQLNFITQSFNNQSEAMQRQQVRLLALRSEIQETATTEERRKEIVEELVEISPDILGAINAQTASQEELLAAIDAANESLINQIVIQRRQEDIDKEVERAGIIKEQQLENEQKIRERLAELQRDYNLSIDESLDPLEKARQALQQVINIAREQGDTQTLNDLFQFEQDIARAERLKGRVEEVQETVNNLTTEKQQLIIELGLDDKEVTESVEDALSRISKATLRSQIIDDLKSDNDTIREAAEERIKQIKRLFKPTGSDDEDEFAKRLQEQRKEYEAYTVAVDQLGKDVADREFATLLEQGKNYGEFLQRQLAATQDFAKQRAIALAADDFGIDLNREAIDKVDVEPRPVNLRVDVDTTSLNAINAKLDKLYADFEAARTDADKRYLAAKIKVLESERAATEELLDDTKLGYEDLFKDISDLNIRQLRIRLQKQRDTLDKLLKDEKKNADAISKVREDITQTEEEIGSKLETTFQRISSIFSGISQLFEKFGNEDLAQLTDQLAGVAQGAGTLAAGIATNNPFAIAQGVLDIANSALTVEVVSDTAKFERAIDNLQRAVDDLDYAISQSIGEERISNRQEAIDQLKELEEQAALAEEAERKARKEVRLLGIKVGDKGEGSGTDPERIQQIQDEAEEARRKVEELNREIAEIYTGTSASSIVDQLVSGFEEGKRSAEDFANTFEDLMKQAMIEALKIKFLERAVEGFFEDFADASESGGGLTTSEIAELRNTFYEILDQSNAELDALNQILNDAGVAGIGFDTDPTQQQGIRGEIQTITEDTGTVLAGALNAIRLDVRQSVENSNFALEYLASIDANIGSLVELMETNNTRLLTIERALS